MIYIRQNTPFVLVWEIELQGTAIKLADTKVSVIASCARGRIDLTDYIDSIEENTITINKNKGLAFIGDYSLMAIIKSENLTTLKVQEKYVFRAIAKNDPTETESLISISSSIVASGGYDSALSEVSQNAIQNAPVAKEFARVNEAIQDIAFGKGDGENSALLKDANNSTGGTPITDGDYERPNPNSYGSAEMQADLDNGLYGKNATAEGQYTMAVGPYSHTEGTLTYAEGLAAHAEGHRSAAIGNFSHAEGNKARAIGKFAHAEGNDNWAEGWWSHVEGSDTKTTPTSRATHAEGYRTIAGALDIDGTAETKESAYQRFFDKFHPNSTEDNLSTNSSGSNETGIVDNTTTGSCSHAEGHTTHAHGKYSHAEGSSTAALGDRSHAEGWETIAHGTFSHSEGLKTIAKGDGAHAEGGSTQAKGARSHAEGFYGIASGYAAHAEGIRTVAEGQSSHAEGNRTKAIGNQSHAEGLETIANNSSEHACGKYNNSTKSTDKSQATLFSIGMGTSTNDRKNALEVKENGDVYIEGVEGRLQDNLNKGGGGSSYDDTELRNLINKKVDQVSGKGLSTNDYTDEDKEKLADIEVATQAEIDALFEEGTEGGDPGSGDWYGSY